MRNFADSSHNPSYDVVFLGDSLSNCAFLPDFLSGACVNLSLGGSNPILEYYILSRYLSNNSAPRICYISFADQSLGTCNSFLSTSTARLLTFSEAREIMAEGERLGQNFTATPPYSVWEFYCLSPRVYQLSLLRGIVTNRKESNRTRLRHADIHSGAYMQPVTLPFGEGVSTKDSFYVSPVNDSYIRKTIGQCVSNGIPVKIVKLPSHPSVSHTEKYRMEFRDYYENLKADYPGIEVDWFEYGLTEDCFVDNIGHMNLKGGSTFTRMLARYYPEDFAERVPQQGNMSAGLEEYSSLGFDSLQSEPSGSLTDIFDE
ncbi:MAG: hypothetical protein IJU95_08325 [Treponema sp.]|nr:hypothetical protein [Treponema sp.]